jgi:hypothetical protein
LTLTQIGFDNDWVEIAASAGTVNGGLIIGTHSLGLKTNRNSICVTGTNNVYQLGNNTTSSVHGFDCSVAALVGVEDIKRDAVSIFPNPSNGHFYFDFHDDFSGSYRCTVTTLTGQIVISKQINDKKDVINLTNNTKGIYILTLENETSRLVKKMILE